MGFGDPSTCWPPAGTTSRRRCANALAVVPERAGILVLADPAHPLAADRLFTDHHTLVRGGRTARYRRPMLEVVQRVVDGVVQETLPKQDTWSRSPRRRSGGGAAWCTPARRTVENPGMLAALGHRVDRARRPGEPARGDRAGPRRMRRLAC
ncbi:hypothetical protein HBB16_17025 [Pseudonocardia sp. MCCB 268]|nr:hypothetical protein [Pseudonocardia cytotoxica]